MNSPIAAPLSLLSLDQVLEHYEPVIGIEIHAQLATKTKMWCHCPILKQAYENETVCAICSAQPGTLPVLNQQAFHLALKAALGLNCVVAPVSYFDRKNYFYPDLPKGYQISQFFIPIASHGHIHLVSPEGEKKVRISRLQMEEDTGKSQHQGEVSLINLNRSSVPLIEIVSEPDLQSAQEAVAYFRKIHEILVYLGVNHGQLQDGNLRCDVNISLKLKGTSTFGTRCEIKNLNSYRAVEKAIHFEIQRQGTMLLRGESVQQETRLFDAVQLVTKLLRVKGDADDYRYFPEPDLTRLVVTKEILAAARESLGELPDAKRSRLERQYGLNSYDASLLCQNKQLASYFEAVCSDIPLAPLLETFPRPEFAKRAANWILSELLHYLNELNQSIDQSPIKPVQLRELITYIEQGVISGKMAKDIFIEMFDLGKTAAQVIAEKNLAQNNDQQELTALVKKLMEQHPKELEQLKAGRDRMMGFFVGQVMKQTGGKANPQMTSDIIKSLL